MLLGQTGIGLPCVSEVDAMHGPLCTDEGKLTVDVREPCIEGRAANQVQFFSRKGQKKKGERGGRRGKYTHDGGENEEAHVNRLNRRWEG